MSESPDRTYRIDWHESAPFIRLFEALPVSLTSVAAMCAAFLGVALTLVLGMGLDWVWPNKPLAVSGQTELSVYMTGGADAGAWTAERLKENKDAPRLGVFELLVNHASQTLRHLSDAVLAVSPGGVLASVRFGLGSLWWLLSMHPWYALCFGLPALLIWGVCGGAISRAAVLAVARDEVVNRRDALNFAMKRASSLFGAAVTPLIVLGLIALALYIGGWIGAIPWIGEILVGLFFAIVLLFGLLAAITMVSAVAGFPMLAAAVVSEDRDAWDALQSVVSFAWRRPWKLAFYYFVALAYGGFCFWAAKWLLTLALWAGGTFLGASMNTGDAFGKPAGTDKTRIEHKLDAMWLAPGVTVDRPFYGVVTDVELHHGSRFARWMINLWTVLLRTAFAAFVASFFYTSASIIFLLLRREVDYTDISEVYVESSERAFGAAASTAAASDAPAA